MPYSKLIATLLLAGFAAIPGHVPPRAEPAATAEAARQVEADHEGLTRITVETAGEGGVDIILVPGLSTPREVWQGLVEELQGQARLHLVEINGFGSAPAGENAGGTLIQGSAEDIARYVDSRDLQRPVLVGHSLGGAVAMLSAIDDPQRYGGVMVVDSAPFLARMFDPEATPESAAEMAGQLKRQILSSAPEERSAMTARGMARTPEAVAAVQGWIEQADQQAVAEGTAELLQLDLRPRLSSLALPVAVVHPDMGDGSARYRQLYADVPEADFTPIPDSGHFVMLDNPDAFLAALRAFIDATGTTAPGETPS